MVCCNVLVINTIGRQAAHDDRYVHRTAIEGSAALQRQQQVVVIALRRRFISLERERGGGRGLGGELSSAGCHNLRYSKWERHAGLW